MPIVRNEDQVIEKVIVQYFNFCSYINNLEKYNKNTLLNNSFDVGLIIVCIFLILAGWGVKFRKKKTNNLRIIKTVAIQYNLEDCCIKKGN